MNQTPQSAYLLLWLEGPLQSWGVGSKFGRRSSLPFPSQSGLTGLLLAALGEGGPQEALLKEFATFHYHIWSFRQAGAAQAWKKSAAHLEDFQTIGTHYDETVPWQRHMIPVSQSKRRVTRIHRRYYLQDQKFAVRVEGPRSWMEQLAQALQCPVWDLLLGRKNCFPSEWIYQGLFEGAKAVEAKLQEISKNKNLELYFEVFESSQWDPSLQGKRRVESHYLKDIPLRFGTEKDYAERKVYVAYPSVGTS